MNPGSILSWCNLWDILPCLSHSWRLCEMRTWHASARVLAGNRHKDSKVLEGFQKQGVKDHYWVRRVKWRVWHQTSEVTEKPSHCQPQLGGYWGVNPLTSLSCPDQQPGQVPRANLQGKRGCGEDLGSTGSSLQAWRWLEELRTCSCHSLTVPCDPTMWHLLIQAPYIMNLYSWWQKPE